MKKTLMKMGLAALSVTLLMTGCQQKPEGAVAKVGDEIITEEEVNTYMDSLKSYYGEEMFNEETDQGKSIVAEAKNNIVEALINQKAMDKILADNDVAVDEAEVDEMINSMKEQMGGEEAFNQLLEAQGVTMDELKQQYMENLKATKFNEFIMEKYAPTEEEIMDYFNKNKDDYIQYNASHILITPDQAPPAEGEEMPDPEQAMVQAKEKADAVFADAQKEGVDFARLAQQQSQDPGSAENGGNLGYFIPSTMVEQFGKALGDMDVDEIVGPIESEFGYHIIKLHEKEENFENYQDEVKEQVKQDITSKITQQKSEELINQYRRDMGVKKYI